MINILLLSVMAESNYYLDEPSFYFEKDKIADVRMPCELNNTICSATAVCNISIYYPNSSSYVQKVAMTNNQADMNYTMENTSTLGTYRSTMWCADGIPKGLTVFTFEINNYGRNEEGTGTLLLVILIPLLIIFIVCLIIAITTESKTSNFTMGPEGDYILEMNYGMYLKILMYLLSYIFLWMITFLTWKISEIIISLSFLAGFLRLIWIVETVFIIPIFLIVSIIGITKHLTDSYLTKLAKRGLRPR